MDLLLPPLTPLERAPAILRAKNAAARAASTGLSADDKLLAIALAGASSRPPPAAALAASIDWKGLRAAASAKLENAKPRQDEASPEADTRCSGA